MKRIVSSRKITIGVVLAILIAVGFGVYFSRSHEKSAAPTAANNAPISVQPQTASPTTIRLVATGDMLPHATVNQAAKTGGSYDYTKFFTQVEAPFKGADIAFCKEYLINLYTC